MYDVTGRASSSSHAPSCLREQKGDMGGWIATKACSRAETCVQEADFLCKKEKKIYLATHSLLYTVHADVLEESMQHTHPAAHSQVAAVTLAKSPLRKRMYTWYVPCFIDGVIVDFTW